MEENKLNSYEIGFLFYQNENFSEAEKCFQQAAFEQKLAEAQYLLGMFYEHSELTNKSIEEVMKRILIDITEVEDYHQSLQQLQVQLKLALVEKNFTKAVTSIKEIIDTFDEVDDLSEDINQPSMKKTLHCYQLAAAQDHQEALYRLGQLYEQGKGRMQDSEMAMKYYQLAADQGHKDAQYTVAKFYEEAKDFPQAFKYYRLAAQQGSSTAGLCYANCFFSVRGQNDKDSLAAQFLVEAAERDNSLRQLFNHLLGTKWSFPL